MHAPVASVLVLLSLASRYILKVTKDRGAGEKLANWEPTEPRRLGDYGTYRAGKFRPEGNIDQLTTLGFVPKFADGNEYDVQYATKRVTSVETELSPGGVAKVMNGKIEVAFGKKAEIYLSAAGCFDHSYSNIAELGRKLRPLMDTGEWKREYQVVTSVTNVTRFAIAISKTEGSSLVLKATAPISGAFPPSTIIMSDPKLMLDVGHKTSGMLTYIGKPPAAGKRPSVLMMKTFRFKKKSFQFVPKGFINILGGIKRGSSITADTAQLAPGVSVESFGEGEEEPDEFVEFKLSDLEAEMDDEDDMSDPA